MASNPNDTWVALKTALMTVSVAEIIDRITILRIKLGRPNQFDPVQVKIQIQRHADELSRLSLHAGTDDLVRVLERVNRILWRLENEIRCCIAKGQFGSRFVCVARMIVRLNERRAFIKSEIDELNKSGFRDTKSYL